MGQYKTFVVRIWCDNGGRMHGSIKQVGTHDDRAFLTLEAILPFIREHLNLQRDERQESRGWPPPGEDLE